MQNIAETTKKDVEKEIEKIVKLGLIRSGIKCDHAGYVFLVQSVKETIADPDLVDNLKELFTIVAKKCGAKDYFRVEANIHNAIVYTYKKKGFGFINRIYGMDVLKPDHKPTTAEFIRLMTEYYTLGLYKNKYEFE